MITNTNYMYDIGTNYNATYNSSKNNRREMGLGPKQTLISRGGFP